MCEFYSRVGNTKFTAIRHSNVYGPHDKFDLDKCHVLPAFINKIVNATHRLEIWGSGKAARDVLYIDDLVDMIDKVINFQHTPYELYNCGYGEAFPILSIAKTIMRLENKNLEIVFDKSKPDIPTTVVLNCNKALFQLGWKPTTNLEIGLKKTIDWYKDNILK